MPHFFQPVRPNVGAPVVPVYRLVRAVSPYGGYGADDPATVKIPADVARALGYTSRKVSVSALYGIRVALGALKSAAIAAGKNNKAREIQGWIDQIYAMEQASKSTEITGAGRAEDGQYLPSSAGSSGSGTRPPAPVPTDPSLDAGTGAGVGLWVGAVALLAAIGGGVYYFSKPKHAPKQNGRRRNGRRRAVRHNPACCSCTSRGR